VGLGIRGRRFRYRWEELDLDFVFCSKDHLKILKNFVAIVLISVLYQTAPEEGEQEKERVCIPQWRQKYSRHIRLILLHTYNRNPTCGQLGKPKHNNIIFT